MNSEYKDRTLNIWRCMLYIAQLQHVNEMRPEEPLSKGQHSTLKLLLKAVRGSQMRIRESKFTTKTCSKPCTRFKQYIVKCYEDLNTPRMMSSPCVHMKPVGKNSGGIFHPTFKCIFFLHPIIYGCRNPYVSF